MTSQKIPSLFREIRNRVSDQNVRIQMNSIINGCSERVVDFPTQVHDFFLSMVLECMSMADQHKMFSLNFYS